MRNTTNTPKLNERRKALKMPIATLVRRSGVPRPTIYRILRGNLHNVRFGHVLSVATVLGLSFGEPAIDPELIRREEAKRKARFVARLAQGTMALEAQAVAPEALDRIEERIMDKLLSGSGKKLWSD